MPKVYADIHNNLIKNYLETSEPKVIGIERTVLCLHKVYKKKKKIHTYI
jgi:hypothetical protein